MRGGEVSQSARSITSSLLSKLYQKNMEFTVQPLSRLRHLENSKDLHWGGARLRMMLQCIYTIAFLCLLRFDEVLRIELKDIEVVDKLKGHIKLTLPFRKTHQYGGLSFCLPCFLQTRNQTFPSLLQPQRTSPRPCASLATLDSCFSIDGRSII